MSLPALLQITIAQTAPRPGDSAGNAASILALRTEAAATSVALLACAKDALAGLPASSFAGHPDLLRLIEEAVERLVAATADGGPALLFTAPQATPAGLVDAAILAQGGIVQGWRARHVLEPGEASRLTAGAVPGPLALALADGTSVRLGVMQGADLAEEDVAEALAESGAEMLLALAAPVFAPAVPDPLLLPAVARATETGLPLLVAALAGARGAVVHAGGSFVLDGRARLKALAPALRPCLLSTEWGQADGGRQPLAGPLHPPPEPPSLLAEALSLRLRGLAQEQGRDGVLLVLQGEVAADRLRRALADRALPGAVRSVGAGGDLGLVLEAAAGALALSLDRVAPGTFPAEAGRLEALAHQLLADRLSCLLVQPHGSADPLAGLDEATLAGLVGTMVADG